MPRDNEQLVLPRDIIVGAISYLIRDIDKDLRVELLFWANMTSSSWA